MDPKIQPQVINEGNKSGKQPFDKKYFRRGTNQQCKTKLIQKENTFGTEMLQIRA